jgi:hypothetical protein
LIYIFDYYKSLKDEYNFIVSFPKQVDGIYISHLLSIFLFLVVETVPPSDKEYTLILSFEQLDEDS